MQGIPKIQEFLDRRDFKGAITILEFSTDEYENREDLLAYSSFHSCDYELAKRIYSEESRTADLAVTMFYLRDFDGLLEIFPDVPESERKNRISMHLANILGLEEDVLTHSSKLIDIAEDQLSLAALQYFRGDYHEALEIYKKVLSQVGQNSAVAVYAAMCYYQLDFYDVAIDLAEGYLKEHPDSVLASNLKACSHYRLGNMKSAVDAISYLKDVLHQLPELFRDIISHNLTVLGGGDAALQVWPQCANNVPEAKLNLALHYLRHEDVENAFGLVKELEARSTSEMFVKAISYCSAGLEADNPEYLEEAKAYFHKIGSSPGDCDTINGRQALASYLFLQKKYEEALVYMDSIKMYCSEDDEFNVNYGQAKTALGQYSDALEHLLNVSSERVRSDFTYLSCLAKCYIATGHPDQAWELHTSLRTTEEVFAIVQLIASCSYKHKYYMVAARAYHQAALLDPKNTHHWYGLRAAVAGVLKEGCRHGMTDEFEGHLNDCYQLLLSLKRVPDAEQFAKTISVWARSRQIYI